VYEYYSITVKTARITIIITVKITKGKVCIKHLQPTGWVENRTIFAALVRFNVKGG